MKTNYRDEKTMLNLIINFANEDDRIRAVILNGSRAVPNNKQDFFQDYDIVFLVTDVEFFVSNQNWIKYFGEILIMQMPDEMDGVWPHKKTRFAYLMLFKDWNRIDLTFFDVNHLSDLPKDSQSKLLLDKDNFINIDPSSDKDYLPKQPSEKEFLNCCNEFFWVATYVAKGIYRKELTYAKYVSENIVKEELLKLLTWYAGMKTSYQKPIGKFGRHLQKFLEPQIWNKLVETYVDANEEHMWQSLFKMCDISKEIAKKISVHYNYRYNEVEYDNVVTYLHEVQKISF